MEPNDRSDFSFHHYYELHGDEIVKFNAADEEVDRYELATAPEGILWDAAESILLPEEMPRDATMEELRRLIRDRG